MNYSGICRHILNGYRSKEFETIVELSHKISRMLGNVEDYERKVEARYSSAEALQCERGEVYAQWHEFSNDVDELLAKQPDEIASAVRTIMFGVPKHLPDNAFGCPITPPRPILESVKYPIILPRPPPFLVTFLIHGWAGLFFTYIRRIFLLYLKYAISNIQYDHFQGRGGGLLSRCKAPRRL